MTLELGEIVADKYRIIRLLGKGGMGEVYEGENLRIRRRVALKTLRSTVSSKPDVVQRFEREAQAAGRIGSEHIVEVLDLGDLPDGSRYMVMEFLEGSTLGERISLRGRIPPREAATIVAELCEGLGAAHNAGIIHRDLKPANVFLVSTKQGRPDFVKILDFGVSKFSVLGDDMSMTSTGAVVGTPYYMSPEQAKGAKFIDARSDLYSVGVILYETITGHVPFNAETFNELIFKIALESPPPAESFVADLDPRMASIIRRAMARDSGARFQSAAELKQVLEAWAVDIDRGVPVHLSAPVGGYPAPQLHAGDWHPREGQPRDPRFGGTEIMGPSPAVALGRQPSNPTVITIEGQGTQPAAREVPPLRAKGAMTPILVASGILGFGVVSIAAALVFHKKPAAYADAPSGQAQVAATDTALAPEKPVTTRRTSDPSSSNTAMRAPAVSASAPAVNLDAAAANGAPSSAMPFTAQSAPPQQYPPPNVGTPPAVRAAPPPATKPGGRSISGSLE